MAAGDITWVGEAYWKTAGSAALARKNKRQPEENQ